MWQESLKLNIIFIVSILHAIRYSFSTNLLLFLPATFSFAKRIASSYIDIVVIEKEEGVEHIPHPLHIVNGCINLIDNEDGTQTDLINYDSEIDEIWVVFDRDPKTFFENQYNEVTEKCEKYGINIGFTNPTFEF